MAVRKASGLAPGWRDIAGYAALLFGLLLFLSLFSYDSGDIPALAMPPNRPANNLVGLAGAWAAYALFIFVGVSAYVLAAGLLIWAFFLLTDRIEPAAGRFGWLALVVISLALIVDWQPGLAAEWTRRMNVPAGGVLGEWLGRRVLRSLFGEAGAAIVASVGLAAGLSFFFRVSPYRAWAWVSGVARGLYARWRDARLARMDRLRQLEAAEKEVATKRRTLEEAMRRFKEMPGRSDSASADAAPPPAAPEPAAVKVPARPSPSPAPPPPSPKPPPPRPPAAPRERAGEDRAVAPPLRRPPPKTPASSPLPAPVPAAGPAPGAAWTLPPIDLLEPLPPPSDRMIIEDLQRTQQTLIECLADYGVDARITNVETGPVITRYEVLPAPGVRVERIANLSNNLGLWLKAESVRVQAPIPGKGVVGIEVPNPKTSIVYLRELLESDAWRQSSAKLPMAVGKDVAGRVMVADLADMPHLLIAGATGSGKTVCMNALLCGLLMSRTPDQVRLLLVDPKMVEFAAFRDLPHLVVPVITDAKKVPHGLRWAIDEMSARYKLFARAGVRNIRDFNARPIARQPDLFGGDAPEKAPAGAMPERVPYIVIVVDELSDLMLTAQAEIENQIARLAQMSRAVGIHMILATQRPSVDVITGTIKANFPARIAFQVAQKNDSRTILDMNGADKLLGRGDMLFLPPGIGRLVRAQGCLVSDRDVHAMADHWRAQGPPSYEMAIVEKLEKKSAEIPDMEEDEEVIEKAIEIIRQTRRASTSSLQRRLRLGYTRAARVMDLLQERGIVGPAHGSDPREILIDLDGEIPQNIDAAGGAEADET